MVMLMNDQLIAFILGIVEGVTEFLPVSSTAHLRIAESLLHVSLTDGYWKMFSIVIQLGAILCLPVYFFHRILGFVKSFLCAGRKLRHPLVLTLVAFIATAIPSFLLLKAIGKNLEDLHIMADALLLGGLIMATVDLWRAPWEKKGKGAEGSPIRTWDMESMTLVQAVVIGLAQAIAAILPGTSRSMATIAAGQALGLSRAAALEFSFFLSMPTMAAATGLVLLKALKGDAANPVGIAHLTGHQWELLAIGFVTSFVVAYASVAFLMHWVRKHGFLPFAVYRLIAGVFVLRMAV
jgi:undecaprenyl-diphosphatase